jgi:hypothetical protein
MPPNPFTVSKPIRHTIATLSYTNQRRSWAVGSTCICEEPEGKTGLYACLNHCWGNSRPACITTFSTLDSSKSTIPWSTLPKTFQDYIITVFNIGMDSRWIDSCCIIRDDKSDRDQEAGKMAQIYHNAFITIAATHAPDSDRGLFSHVRPEHAGKQIYTSGPQSEIYFRKVLPHPCFPNGSQAHYLNVLEDLVLSASPDHFPLFTRG